MFVLRKKIVIAKLLKCHQICHIWVEFQVYFNWHPGQILRHNFFLGSILPLTKVKRWQAKNHSFLPSDLFLFLIWCCWHLVHGKMGLDWSLRGLTNSCIYAKEKHKRVKGNHRSFQNLKTWKFTFNALQKSFTKIWFTELRNKRYIDVKKSEKIQIWRLCLEVFIRFEKIWDMQTQKKMIIFTQPNSCEKVIFLSVFSTSILMKKKTKIAIPESFVLLYISGTAY